MFFNKSIFCTNACALSMRFLCPVFCDGDVPQQHEIMLKNYFNSLLLCCPKTVWNFSAVMINQSKYWSHFSFWLISASFNNLILLAFFQSRVIHPFFCSPIRPSGVGLTGAFVVPRGCTGIRRSGGANLDKCLAGCCRWGLKEQDKIEKSFISTDTDQYRQEDQSY